MSFMNADNDDRMTMIAHLVQHGMVIHKSNSNANISYDESSMTFTVQSNDGGCTDYHADEWDDEIDFKESAAGRATDHFMRLRQ